MRCARGQSSLEYVALLALVAIVLAAAVPVSAAPGLVNAVGRGVRHALCVVTGGGCAADAPAACVLRTARTAGDVTAGVAIARLGRGMAILRVETSDGAIALTLLDELKGSVGAQLGARGHLSLGRRHVAAGGGLEGRLVAELGGGRTWKVRGRAAADALERRLREAAVGRALTPGAVAGPAGLLADGIQRVLHRGAHVRLPAEDERTVTLSAGGELALPLGLGGSLRGAAVAGVTRSRRDGALTVQLDVGGAAGAELLRAAGVASVDGRASVALRLDPRRRPVALTVTGSGRATGLAGLPSAALKGREGRGGEVQASATLDLAGAASAALVRRFAGALAPARAGELPGAARDLAAALGSAGRIDVAAYRTSTSEYGAGLEAALGGGLGVSADLTLASARLERSWTRPPGGVLEQRLDCGA